LGRKSACSRGREEGSAEGREEGWGEGFWSEASVGWVLDRRVDGPVGGVVGGEGDDEKERRDEEGSEKEGGRTTVGRRMNSLPLSLSALRREDEVERWKVMPVFGPLAMSRWLRGKSRSKTPSDLSKKQAGPSESWLPPTISSLSTCHSQQSDQPVYSSEDKPQGPHKVLPAPWNKTQSPILSSFATSPSSPFNSSSQHHHHNPQTGSANSSEDSQSSGATTTVGSEDRQKPKRRLSRFVLESLALESLVGVVGLGGSFPKIMRARNGNDDRAWEPDEPDARSRFAFPTRRDELLMENRLVYGSRRAVKSFGQKVFSSPIGCCGDL
jgi:hypothetical protein